MKEIIGLAYFNQAAVFLQEGHYTKALDTYIKAEQYVPDDALIKEFLGYAHLFVGQLDQGEAYLEQVRHHVPDYAVAKNTIAEDYLQKVIDIEGLKVVFHRVDEDRTSILAKKDALEKIVERCPHFRAGILQLAVTWLQLHRTKEALEILARYDSLDSTDPEVNYYLAVLYGQRHMYQKAWHHLQQAERIVHRRQHDPKALKDLRLNLATSYPEPRGLHENLYTYR
jgi:tetratricopeptide (TPR) repeat protein